MKIESTRIGNYTLNRLNNTVKDASTKSQVNVISRDEKKFFINKYPDKKAEIADYHFYHKDGSLSGVKVGSLFDKRG